VSDEPESELSMSEQARAKAAHPAQARAEDAPPTLYEWAGGSDAFRAMINAFYDRVESDELLSPLFPGGVSQEHRSNVATWWIEVFGGPADYTAELGGYERMLAITAGCRSPPNSGSGSPR